MSIEVIPFIPTAPVDMARYLLQLRAQHGAQPDELVLSQADFDFLRSSPDYRPLFDMSSTEMREGMRVTMSAGGSVSKFVYTGRLS